MRLDHLLSKELKRTTRVRQLPSWMLVIWTLRRETVKTPRCRIGSNATNRPGFRSFVLEERQRSSSTAMLPEPLAPQWADVTGF